MERTKKANPNDEPLTFKEAVGGIAFLVFCFALFAAAVAIWGDGDSRDSGLRCLEWDNDYQGSVTCVEFEERDPFPN